MIRRILLLSALLCYTHVCTAFTAFAQRSSSRSITLRIEPVFGSQPLTLGERLHDRDSLRISMLKLYLSAIELVNGSEVVWTSPKKIHLVNAADSTTLVLRLDVLPSPRFTELRCLLGIDSAANAAGALGGDADPTKGMYWSWQSGYIFFKLEGTSPRCRTRNNLFQFHLGGYTAPFQSLQLLSFTRDTARAKTDNDAADETTVRLQFDVQKFLSAVNLAEQPSIMIPCADAVRLSQTAAKSFRMMPIR